MNMFLGFNLFWKRTFDYSGKTSRSEFWWGVLPNAIIMVILFALLMYSLFGFAEMLNDFSITMIVLFSLFCVIELFPSISLIIRRMHDIGLSGYYINILLIPIFGFVWYLYLVTRPSDHFKNNNYIK